jgi:pyruvate,water dikinase
MPKQKIILKGIPASVGIAEGKVKLILDPAQCSKMKRGNILVTEMTNPLFMPAIKKAKAIITDIGGLLCHAAIVSRELRIPCIVNTKRATKILKDNQKIIVDAIKGEIYAAN